MKIFISSISYGCKTLVEKVNAGFPYSRPGWNASEFMDGNLFCLEGVVRWLRHWTCDPQTIMRVQIHSRTSRKGGIITQTFSSLVDALAEFHGSFISMIHSPSHVLYTWLICIHTARRSFMSVVGIV